MPTGLSLSAELSPEGQACTHHREALQGSQLPTTRQAAVREHGYACTRARPQRMQAGGRSRAARVAGSAVGAMPEVPKARAVGRLRGTCRAARTFLWQQKFLESPN